MKTIIAPVDFSDASTNALSFAAEVATRTGARLLIVNILDKPEDEATAKSKLKEVEAKLNNDFGTDLRCEASFVHGGSLIAALATVVDNHQPDLIVMGTKGASGLKRILMGSNTVNVLAETKVPVLVIPEEARFEDFLRNGKNRIVLATDLESVDNEEGLELLKEIALLVIEPKVRVLSVRPKNTMLDPLKSMERDALLSLFRPEIESERATVFSGTVMGGINYYLNEHSDTGLVAMIARDSGRLIQKHYTHEMASHTHLPLLVLHDD